MPVTDARVVLAMTDDLRYKLLHLLEAHPEASQRDIARELGMSLGKVNYCLRALIDDGWIAASSVRNGRNRAAYVYLLTPVGTQQVATLADQSLRAKLHAFDVLRAEIKQMRRDAQRRRMTSKRPGTSYESCSND